MKKLPGKKKEREKNSGVETKFQEVHKYQMPRVPEQDERQRTLLKSPMRRSKVTYAKSISVKWWGVKSDESRFRSQWRMRM